MFTKKILVTCPPMINQINRYIDVFKQFNIEHYCPPDFTQTLTEKQLCDILPKFDGWIIGDDPATLKVLKKGKQGKLKACVKWGVGIDNVDFEACHALNIPITNTPNMFGNEVADIAIGYIICLARKIHIIDSKNKLNNEWFKPCGMSLTDKKICVIGFGDIGSHLVDRLIAFNMKIFVSDPYYTQDNDHNVYKLDGELMDFKYNVVKFCPLNECLQDADFIVSTCSLNQSTKYMLNKKTIKKAKKGVMVINVSRGPIIKEDDLVELLKEGFVGGVGLDVFENEPLNKNNELFQFSNTIFGSHNGSNTLEAVDRTSYRAIQLLSDFLK